MALTRSQKYALAYTDWVAGASTAATGAFSFLIGGAASLALYYNNGWDQPLVINPGGGQVTTKGCYITSWLALLSAGE